MKGRMKSDPILQLLISSLSIILQQPSPTYPPARITALIRWVISLLFPFRRLRRAFAAAGLSACRVGLPSLPLSSRTCRPRQSGRSSRTCPHGPGAKSPLLPVTQTAVGAARPMRRQQQLSELSNARVVSAAPPRLLESPSKTYKVPLDMVLYLLEGAELRLKKHSANFL